MGDSYLYQNFIMKKILIIDHDQKFIGDLQTKFARRYEILATEDYSIALNLLNKISVNLLLARLPPDYETQNNNELRKVLKKLKHKKFKTVSKILIAQEGGDYQIKEYLKYGVSAIVVDVKEVERWVV